MSAEFRQRADLLGTQVITRDTGKRLGVVSQLWVDIDSREVVALSLRPSLFYGTPQPMMLTCIRQIGDVILVDDENVLEDIDVEQYTSLINCEVITETGDVLGKVRGYKFDIDSGKLETLTIASLGFPLIPDQVVSTFELGINEVVSSGPDRLIVYEGCEERVNQLTVGVLERLGLGKAPWERENEFPVAAPIRPENQLPAATRAPMEPPTLRRHAPNSVEETWDEDNWEQEAERVQAAPPPRQQARFMEVDDDDNWSNASDRDRYDEPKFEDDYDDVEDVEVIEVIETPTAPPATNTAPQPATNPASDAEDPWHSESSRDRAKLDLPESEAVSKVEPMEKVKQVEYEE
ncbi:MAG: PRC-barrel domain-containing protein [Synechococcales bacterium]|nr:PRC-barrel domain-containing protein [Synechococcales bacterium]